MKRWDGVWMQVSWRSQDLNNKAQNLKKQVRKLVEESLTSTLYK